MLRERRQEGCDDLEVQVVVVVVAVGATLQNADLIVKALDDPETYLVVGMAVRDDAVPMPLDHIGKALVGLEALPLQAVAPSVEEGTGPDGVGVIPELAKVLLEHVRGVQTLVGVEQLAKARLSLEREIVAVREQRVALTFDEGAVFLSSTLVLVAAYSTERVGQVSQDMELVKSDSSVLRVAVDRVAKWLPHVDGRQLDSQAFSRSQSSKKKVAVSFRSSLPADPNRTTSVQIADDDAGERD